MKISGFTFAFNAVESGMPIVQSVEAVRPYVDEVIAVDVQSTDNTRHVLSRICDRVIDGPAWQGRDIQHQVFELHTLCKGDIIIMFEADEVYEDGLLSAILWEIERGYVDIGVWRVQIEQNAQRIRQYPIPVHRVFPKGRGSYQFHPTDCPDYVHVLPPAAGFLWDCSMLFRDNIEARRRNQAKVWGEGRRLFVREHFTQPSEVSEEEEAEILNGPHWGFTHTPLNIPAVLKPLLGMSRYEAGV